MIFSLLPVSIDRFRMSRRFLVDPAVGRTKVDL